MRSKCQSWDEPGWNCLLRAHIPKHQVWLETSPGDISSHLPKSIRTKSCPAPCLASRRSCKPQGIPNPAQTPGTDTTAHIQLCPEHLPASRLVLSQEKEFDHCTSCTIPYGKHPWLQGQVLTVLWLQAGCGTAGFTCRGGGKRENIPQNICRSSCVSLQNDQGVTGRGRRAARP